MQKCYERFIGRSALWRSGHVRVIDIGGSKREGTYADIFSHPTFEYIVASGQVSEVLDAELKQPYDLPFADGSAEVIISGQAFGRVDFFWLLFKEMVRVVSPNGFIFLVIPSSGSIQQESNDCYRFLPEALNALSRYGRISLIDSWHDDRGPWNDLVGIFSQDVSAVDNSAMAIPPNRYMASMSVAPLITERRGPEIEKTSGKTTYKEVLRRIHELLQPCAYLEIGVRRGHSLKLANCPAIAVDPDPDVQHRLPANHHLYRLTSDAFFDEHGSRAFADVAPDLIFIDGMHLFEFALRDFINAERRAASTTTIVVIDDVYPNHRIQAERRRQSQVWTGDVWKLHRILTTYRPDLLLIPLDTNPTGLLLIAGLDPANRTLSENYNALVERYKNLSLAGQEDCVLTRRGARAADDPIVEALLVHVRAERARITGARPDILRRWSRCSAHDSRILSAKNETTANIRRGNVVQYAEGTTTNTVHPPASLSERD